MKNIKCKILNCVKPLNDIESGLGDLVLKTLKEKQKKHSLIKLFKLHKIKFPSFSDSEYKLSTLVYYGTPMTGKFKRIYDTLINSC